MFLSIITPSYNRAYILPNIYKSLSDFGKDFEWIIIDDGSQDNTEEIVKEWKKNANFNITFVKKINGGKTNALITAFEQDLKGDFSLVLDSDDYLSEDFFNDVLQILPELSSTEVGLVGLKSDLNGTIIGDNFKSAFGNYVDLYYGEKRTYGDKLFVVRTDIYKKSLVASFPNEKLIPESVFYINMSKFGNFRFINKFFYKGEYLEDGLSFDVDRLAANNIEGFIYEKRRLQELNLPFKEGLINNVKYVFYSLSAGLRFSKIINLSNNKVCSSVLIPVVYVLFNNRINKIKKIRLNNLK